MDQTSYYNGHTLLSPSPARVLSMRRSEASPNTTTTMDTNTGRTEAPSLSTRRRRVSTSGVLPLPSPTRPSFLSTFVLFFPFSVFRFLFLFSNVHVPPQLSADGQPTVAFPPINSPASSHSPAAPRLRPRPHLAAGDHSTRTPNDADSADRSLRCAATPDATISRRPALARLNPGPLCIHCRFAPQAIRHRLTLPQTRRRAPAPHLPPRLTATSRARTGGARAACASFNLPRSHRALQHSQPAFPALSSRIAPPSLLSFSLFSRPSPSNPVPSCHGRSSAIDQIPARARDNNIDNNNNNNNKPWQIQKLAHGPPLVGRSGLRAASLLFCVLSSSGATRDARRVSRRVRSQRDDNAPRSLLTHILPHRHSQTDLHDKARQLRT